MLVERDGESKENVRPFAPKMFSLDFFKLASQKGNDLLLTKRQKQKKKKKRGVTDFVLERTCPEKYPKSEKSGFVS